MYYKTRTYQLFSVCNYIFLAVLAFVCIVPLLNILAVSLSSRAPANANLVGLWPVDFTWDAYAKTLDNENFIRALGVSVIRTALGTAIGMALVFLAAYPLSKDEHVFKGRSVYSWGFLFTMLFSGGLVPSYLLIVNLGLMNSIWALILPGAVNVWLVILMLNFFRNIPKELEEAALIDGASHFRTMLSIYLPISTASIATLSLFTMVGHWNSWFDGMIYMTDYKKYPLSTFLQTIIVQGDFSKMKVNPEQMENLSQRTVKAAQIFIGAVPILLVYPYLQKYFVKGIVLGSVKE